MKIDVRHKEYTIGLYDIFILCALPSNIFIFSASFLLVSFHSSLWSFLRAPLCSWVDCTSFFSCALWISICTWYFVRSSTGICHFLKVLLFLQQSNYFSNPISIPFESSFLFVLYSLHILHVLQFSWIQDAHFHKTLHDQFHFLAARAALYLHGWRTDGLTNDWSV